MSVSLYLVHREEALAKGFVPEDFTMYLDFLSAWLATLGVNDFSYGSLPDNEKRPQFQGGIVAYIEPPKDASPELESFLASMAMTQDMGNWGPYALQNLDPKLMKMVLAAWRLRNEYHRKKLEQVTRKIGGALRSLQNAALEE